MRFRAVLSVVALTTSSMLVGCGPDDDDDAAPATTSAPTTTAAPPSTTGSPTTASSTTIASTTTSSTGVPATTPTTAAPTTIAATTTTTEPAALVEVKIYLLRGERLVIAHRQVAGPGVLRGALTELLEGPTDAEQAAGLGTTVPDGTALLDVALADGLATVDLSRTFESGGGSLSMTARIAQVVFTATQFPNVDRVEFWLDGEPIEAIGGEGVMLDEPQTRADVDRNLSGSVIIDTPAPGATVARTFTVTGEGDVFEAQFPIEVWAGGVQVGGIAPVTAGAWGTWAEFEVEVTVDAPPGPIELVAYDAGGCGTDPECPAIIKTVVPLVLGG